ncbi:disease resistance protein RGA2-like [Rhododendron vialii]|uniref:disease resistance protein RGA2-like n=1 Tax=Rhododendron vialii TaxID=182163 RepID=UPI00265D9928|nr:disease resistance protein RGA2-like [Rhododendron vialii]
MEELGNLTKLRGRLVVRDLQNVKDKEEAKKAKMFQKSKPQELTLYWDGDLRNSNDNHEDVLEGLKPHRKVKGLILRYFGGRRLASWMSTTDALLLLNLVKINQANFRLCEQVPVLGHLPHLAMVKMVRLHNLKRIGPEFYGPDEGIIDNCSSSGAAARVFPALREFQRFDMPQLEEWSDVSSLPVVGTRMLEFFPHLQKLDISKCPKLITIPAFNGLTSLQHLEIERCPEFSSLPKELLQPTLVDIRLKWCPKLKTPNLEALRGLTSLKNLTVEECPILWSYWEEGLVCTTNLQSLHIGEFTEKLRFFPWPSPSAASSPWCHFTSLKYLVLVGWAEVRSLPDQLEHLSALTSLKLQHFSGLESLPEWLGNLSSLQSLEVHECPLLEERCEEGGEDWHKIAHIASIQIVNLFFEFLSLPLSLSLSQVSMFLFSMCVREIINGKCYLTFVIIGLSDSWDRFY